MTEKNHQTNWEKKWLEGTISSEQARELSGEGAQFESLEKFISRVKNLDAPHGVSKEEAWQKLESAISMDSSPKIISLSRRNWIIGIAASLILAIGAFFILQQNTHLITIDTSLAEVQMVDLPDGSTVYLNAESSISFPEKGWTDSREVKLSGEAFFDVKRGSSFTVKTENGSIQVLGTSFNVRSRVDLLQVACKTGKVKVSSADNSSEQIITPGLAVTVEKGLVSEPMETSLSRIDGWRNGQYDYESIPLQQVLDEVKRLYNAQIEHDFSESELTSPITTTFSSMGDAAQTIAVSKGRDFEVDENDNKIIFKVK
ncbi:MAG: FecR domain-containing protein [Flavobacteriaceae bacterium]|nr:FecR domain-containing protein [Flavobacteriaceae bacterium]